MPVSVGRHNLARLRAQLKLTQSDLAKLADCSTATIKAVEIGKLALSDSLASRISYVFGIEKEWLLKNDLKAPLPGNFSQMNQQEVLGRAEDTQTVLLLELFSRLFAVVAKMKKTPARTMLETVIAIELDGLKKLKKPLPDCQPSGLAGRNSLEFLLQHSDSLDPDLKQWVDLKGLLKSNLQLSVATGEEPAEAQSPKRPRSRTRSQA